MRKSLYVLVLWAGLSMTAWSEDWTGKLIDATCNDQKQHEKTISCDATKATTAFALDVMGKIYKLDDPGNAKAATALKYRAAEPADSSSAGSTEVKAKITGTEAGGMILVETVGLQRIVRQALLHYHACLGIRPDLETASSFWFQRNNLG
jgi:hypothetical protein